MKLSTVMAAIAAWDHEAFEWGKADCCQFTGFVLQKLTGRALIPWEYDSKAAANAILEANNGLLGAVEHVLGRPVVASEAVYGDPVLWRVRESKNLIGLGVLVGGRRICTLHHESARPVVMAAEYGQLAWRVCPE